MVLSGYGTCIAGDLRPAEIVDPAVVAAGDPAEIAAACLAAIDPGMSERMREGDLLLLDGVLSDGAVIALQAVGFAAVICRTAAPEVVALGAAYALPILASAAPGAIDEGALVRVDLERGQIESGGTHWQTEVLEPEAIQAVRRYWTLRWMRRTVEDEGFAE
jgi:hypothetical protein